jgi:hypothetical protein
MQRTQKTPATLNELCRTHRLGWRRAHQCKASWCRPCVCGGPGVHEGQRPPASPFSAMLCNACTTLLVTCLERTALDSEPHTAQGSTRPVDSARHAPKALSSYSGGAKSEITAAWDYYYGTKLLFRRWWVEGSCSAQTRRGSNKGKQHAKKYKGQFVRLFEGAH